ncbi:hypothetical protein QR680_015833 [Steinernema hermaphroditum]|uniref:Uncharacterized protein n=1 Tax=Steinernema hermaphroditum TaxID=289476 RepID=A0AA39LKW5_9BILA|nr:hypothetical protein QR680_015833 [Steinernema hermaphroditum]
MFTRRRIQFPGTKTCALMNDIYLLNTAYSAIVGDSIVFVNSSMYVTFQQPMFRNNEHYEAALIVLVVFGIILMSAIAALLVCLHVAVRLTIERGSRALDATPELRLLITPSASLSMGQVV